jgi:outer membrane protein assembly factor BamB
MLNGLKEISREVFNCRELDLATYIGITEDTMIRRRQYLIFIFVTVLFSCGPSGQKPKSKNETHAGATSSTYENTTDEATSEGLVTSTESLSQSDEPNVPFAMEGGGPRHLHRASIPGPKTAPKEISSFHTGNRIAASPIIGPDGTIYIGSTDGTFNALSRDGSLRWSYICDEPIFGTAAVSQTGKVFVGCDDNTLIAFSTDGTLRFTVNTKQDMDSSPVIADDGTIFVGGDSLYALDNDGKIKFKLWLGGHVSASPAVRPDGVISVGSHDRRFYMAGKDGTVLSVFDTKGPILGPAAALQNNDVVFGSDDRVLYRLNAKGTLRWKLELDGALRSGIAVNEEEDTVYVGSMAGTVFAIDAKKGTVRWKTATAGPIAASPMLDSQGLLFVASRDHSLYALDAISGAIVWRISLDAEIDAAPAVAFGKRLIAAADDGKVRILEEQP